MTAQTSAQSKLADTHNERAIGKHGDAVDFPLRFNLEKAAALLGFGKAVGQVALPQAKNLLSRTEIMGDRKEEQILKIDRSEVRTISDFIRTLTQSQNYLCVDYLSFGVRCPLPINNPKLFLYGNFPEEPIRDRMTDIIQNVKNSVDLKPYGDSSREEIYPRPNPIFMNFSDKLRMGYSAVFLHKIQNNGIAMLWIGKESGLPHPDRFGNFCQKIEAFMFSAAKTLENIDIIPVIFSDYNLSKKEKEVGRWIADGKTSSEIGLILGVSTSTVNFHIKSLNKKFGTNSKAGIVAFLISLGLI
ncbi:MAG: hypothetical protein CBARDCOR_6794 [uncultured Caballeronia sp.]|nr:MAG: hypothetical protein CBARDCOR_6794 [uncultured Caballeronia sp.]